MVLVNIFQFSDMFSQTNCFFFICRRAAEKQTVMWSKDREIKPSVGKCFFLTQQLNMRRFSYFMENTSRDLRKTEQTMWKVSLLESRNSVGYIFRKLALGNKNYCSVSCLIKCSNVNRCQNDLRRLGLSLPS